MCVSCRYLKVEAELTTIATLQAANTSRARGGPSNPQVQPDVDNSITCNVPDKPPTPQANTARASSVILLKDGEPIPEGYRYMVHEGSAGGPSAATGIRTPRDAVAVRTPPKAGELLPGVDPDSAKSRTAARRNLARNMNRMANANFAKEMKDSLATGRTTTIKVPEVNNDLKGTWHATAKEVAYKFLDLRKNSWKDYSMFEKGVVHKELKAQYKFDPPLDPKRVENYLSSHLRTSRAVWKAHWKKYGDSKRHNNCPEEAWEKLTRWWCTDACEEEAADMASRRAKVQSNSRMGRTALVDRMDEEVSDYIIVFVPEYYFSYILAETNFMRGMRQAISQRCMEKASKVVSMASSLWWSWYYMYR